MTEPGRIGGLAVGVDPDRAEVGAEAAFHVGPQAIVEGLSAAPSDDLLDRRSSARPGRRREELDDAGVAGAALEVEQGVRAEVAGFAGGQGAADFGGPVLLASAVASAGLVGPRPSTS